MSLLSRRQTGVDPAVYMCWSFESYKYMVGDEVSPNEEVGKTSRRKMLRLIAGGVCGTTLTVHTSSARRDVGPQSPAQVSDFELDEGPAVAVESVVTGLTSPMQFVDPAGSEYQYIVDQPGKIFLLRAGQLADTPFLDVSEQLVALGEGLPDWVSHDERGLLGLEFHPNFPADPRFYVRYSTPIDNSTQDELPDYARGEYEDLQEFSHTDVLAEFRAYNEREADPESENILLEFPQPLPVHQAGTLTFGPDDYLYLGLGDGGWGHLAQDTTSNLLGSILRIDIDAASEGSSYSIPSGNPLVDKPGRPEYFAWGFRNPWRMSFHEGTLFVADVGESRYEEVNIVAHGENYGWPIKEGTSCYNSTDTENCDRRAEFDVDRTTELVDPVTQFPHTAGEKVIGYAVVGGYVYDHAEIPALQGQYIFSNYSSAWKTAQSSLFATDITSKEQPWPISRLAIENIPGNRFNRNTLSFGQDTEGHLYVLTTQTPLAKDVFSRDDGEVFRIKSPD